VQHPFAEVLMQQPAAAPAVVQALLRFYSERPPLPARAPLYVATSPTEGGGGGGSTVIRFVRTAAGEKTASGTLSGSVPEEALRHRQSTALLDSTYTAVQWASCAHRARKVLQAVDRVAVACAAASVLWLPYTAFTLLVRSSAASGSPLADTGEVLLLMLACHAPAAGLLPPNPFRAALQTLQVPQRCSTRPSMALTCPLVATALATRHTENLYTDCSQTIYMHSSYTAAGVWG
jgi:hypothetical protein